MPRGAVLNIAVAASVVLVLVVVAARQVLPSSDPPKFSPRRASFVARGATAAGDIAPRVAVFADGSAVVAWLGLPEQRRWADRVELRSIRRDGVAGSVTTLRPPEPYALSPVVARGADDALWVAYLGAAHSPDEDTRELSTIHVARSAPGTTALGAPANVGEGDAAAVWGGNWAAPLGDHLVVVHREVVDGRGRLVLHAVGPEDPGAQVVAEGPALAAATCAVCTAAARVYVVWREDTGTVKIRASDDGAHFRTTLPVVVSTPGEPVAPLPPACAAVGDEVDVVYGRPSGSPVGGVSALGSAVVARSSDAGRTFAARTTLLEAHAVMYGVDIVRAPAGAPVVAYLSGATGSDDNGVLRWVHLGGAGEGEPAAAREAAGRSKLPPGGDDVNASQGALRLAAGSDRLVAVFADAADAPHVAFLELEP